ncbi:hypothetical protein B4U80_01149 [Leptotrombidium deliense]|uniref:Uncharacterized protein n=1 Tax=Leptotrombidium deliense TaxID=299467 RepID=A0A443SJ75_9ACAR|nr:hypothetical protein B4U80_01149 [Leptotrombidium deliense]
MKNIILNGNQANYSQSLNKALNYYKACTNMGKRNEIKYDTILQVLKEFKGWPLLNKDWNEQNSYVWEEEIARFNSQFDEYYILFKFFVHVDIFNKSQSIMYIDQPIFGMNRTFLTNTSHFKDKVDAYKLFIKNCAKFLGSNQTLDNEIDELITFESELANAITNADELKNINPVRISISELQENQTINWLSLLQKTFEQVNIDINSNEYVFIRDLNYLRLLSSIVERTEKRTIANYISWRIVEMLAPYATEEMRNAIIDFRLVELESIPAPSVEDECVSVVEEHFKYTLGHQFIKNIYDTQITANIEQMIKLLKVSLTVNFQTNDWMDENARIKAQLKLHAMGKHIASPPWVNNSKELETFYEKLEDIYENKYMDAFLKISKWKKHKMLSQLRLSTNFDQWPIEITSTTAFYATSANLIIIPAGMLQPPFYDLKRPAYMNFGAIGSIIGHEITHGFDTKGSNFDENGNNVEWWTSDTKNAFKEKSKCFVDQYSQYKDPVSNTDMNAVITLNENIADNGGLRQSYSAFKMFATDCEQCNQKLPFAMERFTSDQLFFITFANMWCITKKTSNFSANSVYSHPKWRVNGVLSNSEHFSRTFNCPKTSKMNPTAKCKLW